MFMIWSSNSAMSGWSETRTACDWIA